MNIVIVVNNFPPISDGVGDYSFFLANELIRQQHSVSIICKNNVQQHTLNGIFPIVKKWDKENCKCVIKKIQQIKPDWVLLQYVPHGYNKYGISLSLISLAQSIRALGIKLLINFHELWVRPDLLKPKITIISLLQHYVAFKLCKYADCIVTSIDSYEALLGKISNKKVNKLLIPPNFNTGLLPDQCATKELKKRIAGQNKVLTVFGVRDPEMVLAIFDKCKMLYPALSLLVCGKNLFPEDVKHRDDIFFTGMIPAAELPSYIACGDVFLAADLVIKGAGGSSNKSGSIAAALFLGIPIVGTKGDMNNDAIIRSDNVYLEDAASPEMIVKRIVMLLNSSSVESQHNIWQEELSWKNTAGKISLLLEKK